MHRCRIGWGALLLAAAASPAFAQGYSTTFDNPAGWLPGDGVLYSPYIPLTGLTNPTLSFRCKNVRRITLAPVAHPLIAAQLGPCSADGIWHRHEIALDPAWGAVQVAFELEDVRLIDDFAVGERASPAGPAVLAALSVLLLLSLVCAVGK